MERDTASDAPGGQDAAPPPPPPECGNPQCRERVDKLQAEIARLSSLLQAEERRRHRLYGLNCDNFLAFTRAFHFMEMEIRNSPTCDPPLPDPNKSIEIAPSPAQSFHTPPPPPRHDPSPQTAPPSSSSSQSASSSAQPPPSPLPAHKTPPQTASPSAFSSISSPDPSPRGGGITGHPPFPPIPPIISPIASTPQGTPLKTTLRACTTKDGGRIYVATKPISFLGASRTADKDRNGRQCVLCGGYFGLGGRNVLRHFRTKHPNYLGGRGKEHEKYPTYFHFGTSSPKERCPAANRPPRELVEGVDGVDLRFLEYCE